MTIKAKLFLAAAAAVAAPAQALAHPGNHADLHAAEGAAHFVQSPFHMAGIAAGLLIVAAVLWRTLAKR